MVEEKNPDRIIEQANSRSDEVAENVVEALQVFIDKDGLLLWEDAVSEIADELDLNESISKEVVADLTGDIVDPVQAITVNKDRYVGIIQLQEYECSGAYGYIHYSDNFGKRKRVICAQCVEECETDSQVKHATEGEGSVDNRETWETLLNKVTSHYADKHEESPDEIDIGASLVSSTTMGGNQAWHQGNVTGGSNVSIGSQNISIIQGSGSGLDADTVDGKEASSLGGGIDTMKTYIRASARGSDTYKMGVPGATLEATQEFNGAFPKTVDVNATFEFVFGYTTINYSFYYRTTGGFTRRISGNGYTTDSQGLVLNTRISGSIESMRFNCYPTNEETLGIKINASNTLFNVSE